MGPVIPHFHKAPRGAGAAGPQSTPTSYRASPSKYKYVLALRFTANMTFHKAFYIATFLRRKVTVRDEKPNKGQQRWTWSR